MKKLQPFNAFALKFKIGQVGAWHNIVIFCASLCFFLFEPASSAFLQYNRLLVEQGEIWRLITGNWVHLSFAHTALNLGGLSLIALIFLQEQKWLIDSFIFIALCLFVGIGVHFFSPEIGLYVGLSGVLHGYFAYYCSRGLKSTPWICLTAWLGVTAKVIYEQTSWYSGGETEKLIGGTIATDAHLYGLIGGSIIGLIWLLKHYKKVK